MTTRQALWVYGASKYSSQSLAVDQSNGAIIRNSSAPLSTTLTGVAIKSIIIVAVGQGDGLAGGYSCSVSDTLGLIWNVRRSVNGAGTNAQCNLTVFWAACPQGGTTTITATPTGNAPDHFAITAMSVVGCKSASAPFDLSGSIPTAHSYNSTSAAYDSSTQFGSTFSSVDPNTMLILNRLAINTGGNLALTAGTPSTLIQMLDLNSISILTAAQVFSATQSGLDITSGGASGTFLCSFDALAG